VAAKANTDGGAVKRGAERCAHEIVVGAWERHQDSGGSVLAPGRWRGGKRAGAVQWRQIAAQDGAPIPKRLVTSCPAWFYAHEVDGYVRQGIRALCPNWRWR